MKVCHLTSAHPQDDIRIFHKECVSSYEAGFETYQISCGKTYDRNGVHLIGIGEPTTSRRKRMTETAKKVYQEAVKLDADIYHFHDPELLRYGLKLKKLGKKVIYDSHEDVPAQIMDKTWIPKPLRKIVSGMMKKHETRVVKKIDAVVTATSHIADKFEGRANKVVVVNNYPKLDDIEYHDSPFDSREKIVCYAGGINELRGESIMIEAMKNVDATLIIAGDHEIVDKGSVKYPGRLDRKGINELYGRAVVGLCILKPIDNYFYSQPIKMYEYMAAGLPFVCSDFPGWRKVAEESGAGICVDPMDNAAITEAINTLLKDLSKAQEMGRKGRDYVVNNCTWSIEAKRLISLYNELGGRN
ncbi:MAG: glycosyltransferase [Clostridiales bacterium]|nr:glycosyltransferase [Clostridiales bacterium]